MTARTTRTRRTTGTASADACGASSGMHDAGLCERIRELEAKVRDLESRPHGCHHWHPWTPYWTWTNTGSTTKTFDITNTVTTWRS